MKKIDTIRAFELDGKITVRLYTGSNFVDAELDVMTASNLIHDLAGIVGNFLQKLLAK